MRRLGKRIVDLVASAKSTSALEVYRNFLSMLHGSSVCYSTVAGLPGASLATFYGEGEEGGPAFFDWRSPADLALLEISAGLNLVLLRGRGKRRGPDKLYDSRLLGRPEKETLFVVLEKCPDGSWSAVRSDSGYSPRLAESYFIGKRSSSKTGCLFEKLAEVLTGSGAVHEAHDDGCGDPDRLGNLTERVRKALGVDFAIVVHCGKKRLPEGQEERFVLRVRAASGGAPSTVGLTRDEAGVFFFYETHEGCRGEEGGLRGLMTASRGTRLPAGSYGGGSKRRREETATTAADEEWHCGPCGAASGYRIPVRGPRPDSRRPCPRLFEISPSTFDLLAALGWATAENVESVSEACRLSISAFDVESYNVPAREGEEEEGEGFVGPSSEEELMGIRVKSRQVPALVSVYDYGEMESGRGAGPAVYSLGPDGEGISDFVEDLRGRRDGASRAKGELLGGLLGDLARLRRCHREFFLKELAARDLAVPVEFRRENSDDDDEDDDSGGEELREEEEWPPPSEAAWDPDPARLYSGLDASWRNCIFGRLERNLRDLVGRFVSYAFNGEGYDFVILARPLILHLHSLGLRPKMMRAGARIGWISFKGVELREIKGLLSPGFSLSTLAEMTGLSEGGVTLKKTIFPFSALTKPDDLLAKTLPGDPEMWKSDLSGKTPSATEISAALADFEAKECENVGDYLKHYLR